MEKRTGALVGWLAGEAFRKGADTTERGLAEGETPKNSKRRSNVVYCPR